MEPLFVLAFGGTGSRCLEALTYLAAARVLRAPMHVLMIDPDQSNGNVDMARSQLLRYHRIHDKIEGGGDEEGSHPAFFSTPINASLPPSGFFWQHDSTNNFFRDQIGLSSLDEDSRQLVELLYDSHDLNQIDLSKGYWGRSHIGSLDLFQTLGSRTVSLQNASDESPDALEVFFARLRSAAQKGEPRLLVFGSIFGGTGASGLPAVPPLLQKLFKEQEGLLAKVRLGCVQMTPYFTFGQGTSHDPDSALHPLATQAALYHYALADVGYEAIYLVGAPKRTPLSGGNEPGGAAQRNDPHYAELTAGLAAVHFALQPPKAGERNVFATGGKTVGWETLPHANTYLLREHFTSFASFCLVHGGVFYDRLASGRHSGDRWLHDLVGKDNQRKLTGHEPELGDLRDFAQRFVEWITLLGSPDAGTATFFGFEGADQKLDERVAAERLARLGKARVTRDAYDVVMRHLNSGRRFEQRDGVAWYVHALSSSTDELARTQYSLRF